MKGLVLIFFLPVWAFAQQQGLYPPHSFAQPDVTSHQYSLLESPFPEFDLLINRLASKQNHFKTDKDFLGYIFTQTHRRLLKNYADNASFDQLKDNGTYNCLTATTVYALALKHFHFKYAIIETNYHIFLLVQTHNGQVLLETTDPLNGFVDDADEVQHRVVAYQEKNLVMPARQDQYAFSFSLYREVTLDELEGLLYYNESIRAFNEKRFASAIASLEKVYASYHSPRVEEFSKVLVLSIVSSEYLDLSIKASYVKQVQKIRKTRMEINASK